MATGLVPASKVLTYLAGFGVVAYVPYFFINKRKIFGGSVPSTVTNKEWAPATQQRGLAQPREGSAVPIETNPIKHRKA